MLKDILKVEGFLSFARKFGDKYGKILIVAAKTGSKKVAQKIAEAIVDLIGNKIADKITSAGKTKNKKKEDERNEIQEIYLPPEKRAWNTKKI